MAEIARHAFISGRVQGVAFRAWTLREAEALGLRGWVRNLPDGRVELDAAGEEAAVAALLRACERGPDYARVERVETTPCEDPGPAPFDIRRR